MVKFLVKSGISPDSKFGLFETTPLIEESKGRSLPRKVAIVGPGRRPGPIEESVERARGS